MFKKFLIIYLFIFLFFIVSNASAQEVTVIAAEGKINMQGAVDLLKTQIGSYCKKLDINIAENRMRVEIDTQSGLVLGVGEVVINFSQDCSDSLALKLLKSSGQITAPFILIGEIDNKNNVSGTFNIDLSVPTAIPFSVSAKSMPWQAILRSNILSGELELQLDQFDIYGIIDFKINTNLEKAQFITVFSKREAEIKKDIFDAFEKLHSSNYETRKEGVVELDSIARRLPLDRRPLADINTIIEANLLLELFNGYVFCVSQEWESYAGGGELWQKCLNSAGSVLQRAEMYARESRPRETTSVIFLQIAEGWDRMRHQSFYAPEHVRFDKVENCQRARNLAYKSLRADPFNQQAETFLSNLSGKDGCDGMPLFGVNQEEIDRLKKEALQKANLERFDREINPDKEDDFSKDITAITKEYDDISQKKGESNSDDATRRAQEQYLKAINSMLEAMRSSSKDSSGREMIEGAESAYRDFMEKKDGMSSEERRQAYMNLQGLIQDARNANDLASKTDYDFYFQTANSARDLFTTSQDLKDFVDYINGGSFGEYGSATFLNDSLSFYSKYQESKDYMSHEDAVYASASETFGVSLLTSIPILKAADVAAGSPDRFLGALGVPEDHWSRKHLTGQLKKGSPSTLVEDANKLMVKNSYEDMARAVAYQAQKVAEADGVVNKVKETGNLVTGTTGTIVVATARLTRDMVVGTSKQTFGRLFSYLGSRFY